MDSRMGKMTQKLSLAVVMVAALVLAVGLPGQASGATCAAVGGTDVAGNCTINTPITAFCPFDLTVPGDLLITGAGSINCNDAGAAGNSASPITIGVGGDMEMQAGSAIRAENTTNGGSGADITITVDGNFTMRNGAVISSSKTSGAGDTGHAGDIRIEVGNATVNPDDLTITCATTPLGDILVENGAEILADAMGEAGAIKMFAGKNATINGLVSSKGTTALGRGGPITIDACCDLVIGDDGKVISSGRDFGADLVHLQACVIRILGQVTSTGPAHAGFSGNLCNVNRPGKPLNSGACIEIWAGTTLEIDSTGTHNGEVNADTATGGGGIQGRSWIDVLANGAITIRGITTPAPAAGNNDTNPAFAVHANQGLPNGHGGDVTVISTGSMVTTTGRAVQANASTGGVGGTGGNVVVLASGEVAFGTGVTPAFIEAAGDTLGGVGGTITAQSFNANVTGPVGSQLKVDGAAGNIGTVTLTGCANPAGTYLGDVLPAAARVDVPLCAGGSPSLPVPANDTTIFPSAACAANCGGLPAGNKSGVKFHDLNQNNVQDGAEPGLIGWTIHVFNTATLALVQSTVTVAANAGPPATPDGFYSFILSPGSYTACEELQAGWTQTAPVAVPPPAGETLANCAPFGAANGLTLGPRGYNFTIVGPEVFADNDFGNFQPGVCPEDLLRASKITRVVDETGKSHGPAPVYLTVQDAYNAALPNANEVIGLFSKTTENVVLNGDKKLTITQCTNARVSALDPALPAWTVSSSKSLLIIGPDAVGGKVGWLINTGGHELKGLRANGASLYGIQVVGGANKVAWNAVSGNGGDPNSAGIRVESNGNDLRGGTVSGNTGDGVQIVGSTNTFQGATVESNTKNGVFISGTGNTIKGSKANKNTGAGFLTTAAGNKFQSNASNASSQGGSKENTGPEYDFGGPQENLGSNKADNVTIPTAAKCPTLFSAGGTCD